MYRRYVNAKCRVQQQENDARYREVVEDKIVKEEEL
nr:hypothetical protein BSM_06340 [uncultured archaeon]